MKEEGNKPPFFGGIMVIALCIIGLIAWAIVDNKAKEQQAIQQDSSYLYTSE
ncbi:hypothetical protein HYT26_04015, partial [Candidatus Pacearchaeota archaeon]|nr:hypothetical protein [Candidatus Pacearchaeota archaeon]